MYFIFKKLLIVLMQTFFNVLDKSSAQFMQKLRNVKTETFESFTAPTETFPSERTNQRPASKFPPITARYSLAPLSSQISRPFIFPCCLPKAALRIVRLSSDLPGSQAPYQGIGRDPLIPLNLLQRLHPAP